MPRKVHTGVIQAATPFERFFAGFASSESKLGGSFSVICRSSSDVPRRTHCTKTPTPVAPP